MDFPVTLLNLSGSVALLLWGMHMVQTGVQRAFGSRLRVFLGTALRNRISAFLAGMGVTAILQSSTATGLMVTGFAAGGLVDLVPALAVMLGANVGTTLIVQLLSFDVAQFAPALILLGVLMFRQAPAGPRDFGRVLIGLGLLLMALHQFIELLTPYEDAPSLRLLLGTIATQPILDVILAAGLTWAVHSSVAIVLVIMSFAAKGPSRLTPRSPLCWAPISARPSTRCWRVPPAMIPRRGACRLATCSTASWASRSDWWCWARSGG